MTRTSVRLVLLFVLAAILASVFPAFAQGVITPTDPNANISYPPRVYVVRGEVEVRGSANLPNMRSYFVSFRPLNEDLTQRLDQAFLPAVLPSSTAVQDDVLGLWDTTIVDDGLYELRLTINVANSQPVIVDHGPVRVENNPPPWAVVNQPSTGGGVVVATQAPVVIVPPVATIEVIQATATPDPTPRGTVSGAQANVRQGDSTDYQIIATLTQDQQVLLVGISNQGSGWYQVQLPNGALGWMSPSVITVTGNLSVLPRVQPPPRPATATPIPPTAAPTSSSTANLVAGIVVLDPSSPTCATTFIVGFDVANLGSTQTIGSGTINLTDVRASDGSTQATTVGGFPVLLPNQTFRVNMPLTVSTWYNETHRITLVIDPSNGIPETNESDNTRTVEFVLQKGSCP